MTPRHVLKGSRRGLGRRLRWHSAGPACVRPGFDPQSCKTLAWWCMHWEVETGGPEAEGQAQLRTEFKASLGCLRPHPKRTTKRNTRELFKENPFGFPSANAQSTPVPRWTCQVKCQAAYYPWVQCKPDGLSSILGPPWCGEKQPLKLSSDLINLK